MHWRHTNEFFVDTVIVIDVLYDDLEKIVCVAAHTIKLDHFRDIFDAVGEFLQPLIVVLIGFYRNEHREFQAERTFIQQCHPTADDAGFFKAFDASPAGIGGQANLFCQVSGGYIVVGLQLLQYAVIESIEFHGKNIHVFTYGWDNIRLNRRCKASMANTDTPIDQQNPRNYRLYMTLAWVGLIAALGVGAYFKNPAFALLGALAIRLGLGVNPVKASATLGTLSLQAAIVLLGFTLGVDRLIAVSADYGVIVGVYVSGTLGLGWVLAKLIRGDATESALLTSGTAICGGTAIATLAPLLGAKPHQFAVATALVFLLNIFALLTFPYIGAWLGLSQETFGAWVALAIHDTSSVVATAAIYGDEAAEVATTVKLGRTLWLIPLAFAVSLMNREGQARMRVPGFVLFFVGASVVSSLIDFAPALTQAIGLLSKTLLVFALGMIGLEINRETLREMSLRSIFFGVSLWCLVAPAALLLVLYNWL